VVFNTALTGYQEVLTDPSYSGQMVCFTYPHIGNTGINDEDDESSKCHLSGVIIRDLSSIPSNWRSTKDLDQYLKEQGVLGIQGVDTRALTKALREEGCVPGAISDDAGLADAELAALAGEFDIEGQDLITPVSTVDSHEWGPTTDGPWEFDAGVAASSGAEARFHVVAYDLGVKSNILRRLASHGCRVTVVPASFPAAEVLAMNPDGVFLSNGPGDPSAVPHVVASCKELLGRKPMFGICMGHQIMGQAFGADVFKLKFGHHGANHPIGHLPTGRVEISSQNHNFAVDPKTLPAGVEVTHINLNDGTCAGMVSAEQQAMSIQYHPEASPGPHDADVCFRDFVGMMEAAK